MDMLDNDILFEISVIFKVNQKYSKCWSVFVAAWKEYKRKSESWLSNFLVKYSCLNMVIH